MTLPPSILFYSYNFLIILSDSSHFLDFSVSFRSFCYNNLWLSLTLSTSAWYSITLISRLAFYLWICYLSDSFRSCSSAIWAPIGSICSFKSRRASTNCSSYSLEAPLSNLVSFWTDPNFIVNSLFVDFSWLIYFFKLFNWLWYSSLTDERLTLTSISFSLSLFLYSDSIL